MSFAAPIACIAVLGVAMAMGYAASTHEPALKADLDTPEPSEVPEPAATAEPLDVEIDLAPSGMAAWIRAPSTAKVRATASEVEIVGGPSFHLLVGRGAIDPLGEKARIVRAFGDEFRRYLVDEGDLLVYETGTDQEQRWHFFMTARVRDIGYHCRTPADGLPTRAAIDDVIAACRSVRFADEVALDPAEARASAR